MTLDEIAAAVAPLRLSPLGGFHEDGQTTILLGPADGFWDYVNAQPEFSGDDPLDAWSKVAISKVAEHLNAEAIFPFGGPPFHPFIAWALNSGEAWQSPVGLLVHKDAGLLVSYRGALRFAERITLPEPSLSPCETCSTRPCLTACPVSALGPDGYDVPLCKAHIDGDTTCRAACRVRMSCPISKSYPRNPAQTAFHMEAFHPS